MASSLSRTRIAATLTAALVHGLVLYGLTRSRESGTVEDPVQALVQLVMAEPAAMRRSKVEAPEPSERPPLSSPLAAFAAASPGSSAAPVETAVRQIMPVSFAEAGPVFGPSSPDARDPGGAPQGAGITPTGAATSSAAGVGAPTTDPYPAQVLAWIERHKRYPETARASTPEGTVVVAMTLDRHGRVRDVRLVRSSGHGVLDDAALRQIRETQPFPSAPANATWTRRRFETPIVYRVRR